MHVSSLLRCTDFSRLAVVAVHSVVYTLYRYCLRKKSYTISYVFVAVTQVNSACLNICVKVNLFQLLLTKRNY